MGKPATRMGTLACRIRTSTSARSSMKFTRAQGICVAPHVRRAKGILKNPMAGDIRVKDGRLHPRLIAVEDDRKVLKTGSFADDCMANTLDDYKRSAPPARVWGSDAKSYPEIGSASTMIKMVAPTIEGLRQAFLDPESRIRHYEDHIEAGRDRIANVAWDGGFFSGKSVQFSDQLNCVIGGKGSASQPSLNRSDSHSVRRMALRRAGTRS